MLAGISRFIARGKEHIQTYFMITTGTATVGTFIGGGSGAFEASIADADRSRDMANDVESINDRINAAMKTVGQAAGKGALIGGAPVTYPVFLAYREAMKYKADRSENDRDADVDPDSRNQNKPR